MRRTPYLSALFVLGCSAASPPPEAPPPPPPAVESSPPVPVPVDENEPRIAISASGVSLDGERVAEAPSEPRLQKVERLFDALKARRLAWKASRGDAPHPGAARIVLSPEVTGRTLRSVFQTTAYAGYPNITLEHAGREATFVAQIPGPPCGDGECKEVGRGYTLFVELGDGYRIKLPTEEQANTRAGADGLRAALADVAEEKELAALVAFVAPGATADSFAPRLMTAAEFSGGLLSPQATFSVRELDAVPDTGRPHALHAWRDAGGPVRRAPSNVSGRLPPEVIQGVVRGQFAALRGCYEQGLKKDPALEGRTVTRFVIGLDGKVREAKASGEGFPAEVLACLEGVYRELTFPPPEHGIVSVSYPVIFTPGGD